MKRIACFLAIILTVLPLGGCSAKKEEKAVELIDLSTSDEMITYAQLFNLTKEKRAESVGKKIKVKGTCSTEDGADGGISYFLMFYDGCCTYLTLDLFWNEEITQAGNYPQDGDRILVTGTLSSYTKQLTNSSFDVCCIYADEYEII